MWRTVIPLLPLDGADDIGRSGPWFVFGEDRRADHDAVVQHGDEVSRGLSGELQQRLRYRGSAAMRRSMFAVAVSRVGVVERVQGFGDLGVVHGGDIAAQAQH